MLSFSRDFDFEATSSQNALMDAAFSVVCNEHKSEEIGYYNLPKDSLIDIEKVSELLNTNSLLSSGAITDIAVIGIGGSSLGIKAIDSLISSSSLNKRNLHFFENSDPINISQTLSKLKKEILFL